jgi:hypothetical protein
MFLFPVFHFFLEKSNKLQLVSAVFLENGRQTEGKEYQIDLLRR